MSTLNSEIAVNILINGKQIKIHEHEGKNFIEARAGSSYELEVKNNSNHRIMVVTSVDGVDVLSGEISNENQNGYVIDARNNYKIAGFRINADKVAKFTFTEKNKSYSKNQTGTSRNCGIAHLKIWREKIIPPPEIHHYWHYPNYIWSWGGPNQWSYSCGGTLYSGCGILYSSNSSVSNSDNILRSCSLGTMSNIVSNNVSANLSNSAGQFTLGSAFGQSKVDKVTNTTFEKGEFLGDFVVYYSTKEELIKMGVKFTKENKVALPKAFQNFCVPPDGWVE